MFEYFLKPLWYKMPEDTYYTHGVNFIVQVCFGLYQVQCPQV